MHENSVLNVVQQEREFANRMNHLNVFIENLKVTASGRLDSHTGGKRVFVLGKSFVTAGFPGRSTSSERVTISPAGPQTFARGRLSDGRQCD